MRAEGRLHLRECGKERVKASACVQKKTARTRYLSEAGVRAAKNKRCLLYTSDAADEEDSVDLGGRRMAQGICSVCGTKLNRILGKA